MAVYTQVSEKELASHLAHFDIGVAKELIGIVEGIENTNYHLFTNKGRYILTLFEKRTRPEELPFCISFMKYLHGKGIPCPDVIETVDGEQTIPLKGRPALITTFIGGKWSRARDPFHARAVGEILARMHIEGENFPLRQDNMLSFPAWKSLIETSGTRADEIRDGLALQMRKEIAYLERNWPDLLPTGAVHGDLFPDNVFFEGEKICGIIDFYFSCTYPFIYDLMLTFNAWCFDAGGILHEANAKAFMDAYQNTRTLTSVEKKSINFFGRAAATRIIATRLYDWLNPVASALVKAKNPLEYADILNFYQTKGLNL